MILVSFVVADSDNACSNISGVTTIRKLEELCSTLSQLNKMVGQCPVTRKGHVLRFHGRLDNDMALGDSVVTVGYVMKWTREKEFIKRGAFPIFPTQNGLSFTSINLDMPLLPQLQAVDVILHKATDEILCIEKGQLSSISKAIRFSEGIQQLQRYK
eukprot:Gb_39872 [translate_table: standard]